MSNQGRPSDMRRFFDQVLPKFWSKSRASSFSRNLDVQDSPTNPTNPTVSSAPLSASTPRSNFIPHCMGNNSATTSTSGATNLADHVRSSDKGSCTHVSSPALTIAAPRSVPSITTTTEDGDITTKINVLIPTSMEPSSPTPAHDPIGNSKTKEVLQTAWHGMVYLLQSAEKCFDGTPFKGPIAAINTIIALGNTIIDNEDTLQELVIRTTDRLRIFNLELAKDKDAASKHLMERFADKLVVELVKLNKIKEQGPWKKILDNQESKNKIGDAFKQIDEHVKDLQLHLVIRMDRNIRELGDVLTRLELERWPRSPKATYDANVEESMSLIREPCTPETRTTILADMYQWATDSSPDSPSIFWLTGEAGSGKSTLAYTVAKHFDDDGSILGGNFFCSRQLGETREQKYIIPTIVYHLARKSGSFARALLQADKYDAVDRDLSWQMENLLIGPWEKSNSERGSEFPPYLVIVDALDEINGSRGSTFLAELLKTIDAGHLRRLKFLVTSRPDPNIVRLCESFASKTVCRLYDVPRATIKADITTYLRAKLPKLKEDEELTELADRADGLFVYAATAVRHITPRSNMTKGEQLKILKKLLRDRVSPMHESPDMPSLVDALYRQILGGAFSNLDDDLFRTRLNILHTILCSQERVSTSIAAALHSDSDDMRDVADVVVQELHAVLYVNDSRVFWYHASFPDFIFTPNRSKFTFYPSASSPISRDVDMSCHRASHHTLLTHSCFDIMMSSSGLRFNICQLPSSFLLDSEVPDLSLRIKENISDALRYCSYYWAQHLAQTAQAESSDLFIRIEKFLTTHMLFWIEVMNLLRSSALCTSMLQQARKMVLKRTDEPSNLAQGLADVANFATYFAASPAALSTPHLYISSLATWSPDSAMSQHWKRQFPLIPSLRRTEGKGGHTVPLMAIPTSNFVRCVAFSSDGSRIVSGLGDNTVRVWEASSGVELKVLSGHTDDVSSVAFSSDGIRIVSGSDDESVRVWDASSGAELKVLSGHTDRILSVAFSSNGTRIVSGSLDESVRVWDAISGAELKVLFGHTDGVWSIAYSGDGTRIISGSGDNSVRLWDALSGAELKMFSGHTDGVSSVAFSGDGTRIVSGSLDKSVRVWDASSGAELEVLNGHTDDVSSVAFSNDGTRIVSGSEDNSVRVWDAFSGAELKVLNGHTDSIWSVALSADGTRIVSGSVDESIRVWDTSSGAELEVLSGHTDGVLSVAFSGDGTRIVSGSHDKSVRVWDAFSGVELKALKGHNEGVTSVAFSNDGTRIVSRSKDKFVRVWNAPTGAELKVLSGHAHSVWCVAFAGDGTRIVSGSSDNSMRVWDALSGAELKVLRGHTHSVLSIAFSRDDTRIVSGSSDHTVRVWDTSSGAELNVLNGHTNPVLSVAFSGDGSRIVSGSDDRTLRVWDASSGAGMKALSGHSYSIWSVAFSDDGTRIVSGSGDNTVRVWDALSGAELKVLSGHTNIISSVAFSSDGARIVSGSLDESVRVWDLVYDDDDLCWTSNGANWIVSIPGEDRLMWLPQDILGVLKHPSNSLIISRHGSAQVNFESCKIGPDWMECYTTVLP